MTLWVVTWNEHGVEYQNGPYESRQNAEWRFHDRTGDPLCSNVEMWEMEKVTPENVETPCKVCGGKQTYTHADLTRVALCRWCNGTGVSAPENVEEQT